MNPLFNSMKIRLLFAEDSGADGGVTPPAAPESPGAAAVAAAGAAVGGTLPEGTTPPETPPKPVGSPKFASQLSPAIRDKYKESLEGMGPDASLNDTFTELMDTKGKLSRSILMPEKDNPEDLKRFMKDMGIPESPDGYELDEKTLGAEFTKVLTTQALKAGMTKTQAKSMHGLIGALMKNGQAGLATASAQREETFPARMAEATGSVESADAATKYATKFLIRFGDKAVIDSFKNTGMIYNTTVMSKFADFEKALGDTKFVGGSGADSLETGAKPKGAFGNTYSSQFVKTHGGQK